MGTAPVNKASYIAEIDINLSKAASGFFVNAKIDAKGSARRADQRNAREVSS